FASTKSSRVSNSLSVKKAFEQNTELELFSDHFHDELQATYVQSDRFIADELETGAVMSIPFQSTWLIKPGARYVWAYKTLIPAIGLFEHAGGLSRWLTYSHGLRAPDLAQKHANTSFFVGNPELKPEVSEQVELGFNQKNVPDRARPWESSFYGVSVFTTQYKDFISYQAATTPNTYVNTGRAETKGVEGRGGFMKDNWGLRGEISYLQSEDQNKQPLPLAPEIQTLLNAHFGWAFLIFEAEHTLWTRYFENGQERAGWNTLDLHARTTALDEWIFKVSLFNIADAHREIVRGYPEPGRRLWFSAQRSF
ncbi:MAG TPA: TonB-dependent receptor, partial [Bdellovibrionales bacterium]|nr:TonB-dependent receptor [Bdellovibrionales bacterium]